jgi:hypothetical protein
MNAYRDSTQRTIVSISTSFVVVVFLSYRSLRMVTTTAESPAMKALLLHDIKRLHFVLGRQQVGVQMGTFGRGLGAFLLLANGPGLVREGDQVVLKDLFGTFGG